MSVCLWWVSASGSAIGSGDGNGSGGVVDSSGDNVEVRLK